MRFFTKLNAVRYIFLLFIIISISSCRDEYTICDLSKDVALKTVFYEKITGGERVAVASSFSLKQLGTGPTDFIYKNAANVSRFNIPLNPLLDSAKFIITTSSSALTDTITLIYTSQNVNLSAICGDITVNTLKKVSTTINTIDSIKILNSTVNTTSGENVKLYF